MKLQSTAKMPFIVAFALVLQSSALLADELICVEGPRTPGFWKNNNSLPSWDAAGFKQTASFNKTFGVTNVIDLSFLDALNLRGGGSNALARHAVAAMLNASVDCTNYPYNTDEIKLSVGPALNQYQSNLILGADVSEEEDAIETIKDMYECANENEC